jgi:hypothetical protein
MRIGQKKIVRWGFVISWGCMLILSACGGGDLRDTLNLSEPQARFVHAAPSGPVLTLSRNDVPFQDAAGVSYRASTRLHKVDRGSAPWRLRQANNQAELARVEVDASRGNHYALVAIDAMSGTDLMVVRDPYNVSPPPVPDVVRLRFVHGAPRVGDLDVYLTSSDADLRFTSPVLRDLNYRNAQPRSGENALEYFSRRYRLRLTEAGSRTVVFDADVDLPSKGDWILVAVPGSSGSRSLNVLVARINRNDDVDPTLELTSR